jgi:hypothetical protein
VNDLSGQNWFPTPRPKPPKAVSTPKLVFGTLLPVIVVGVALVVMLTHKSKSKPATTGRSVAAFTACMSDEGADSPSERANARMLRQDAVACQTHLPKGMTLPTFQPASGTSESAREAFAQCMASATANLRGRSRFGGGSSRSALANAVALCRSVTGSRPT